MIPPHWPGCSLGVAVPLATVCLDDNVEAWGMGISESDLRTESDRELLSVTRWIRHFHPSSLAWRFFFSFMKTMAALESLYKVFLTSW